MEAKIPDDLQATVDILKRAVGLLVKPEDRQGFIMGVMVTSAVLGLDGGPVVKLATALGIQDEELKPTLKRINEAIASVQHLGVS